MIYIAITADTKKTEKNLHITFRLTWTSFTEQIWKKVFFSLAFGFLFKQSEICKKRRTAFSLWRMLMGMSFPQILVLGLNWFAHKKQ